MEPKRHRMSPDHGSNESPVKRPKTSNLPETSEVIYDNPDVLYPLHEHDAFYELVERVQRQKHSFIKCAIDEVFVHFGSYTFPLVQGGKVVNLPELKANFQVHEADTLRCILSRQTGAGVDVTSDSDWCFMMEMMTRLGFPVYKAADSLFVLRLVLAGPPPVLPPPVPAGVASEPSAVAGGKASPINICGDDDDDQQVQRATSLAPQPPSDPTDDPDDSAAETRHNEVDEELWRLTVDFFGLSYDASDSSNKANWKMIPGTRTALAPYQLQALTKVFVSTAMGDVNGALVQYDTGLGKTYIGHALAALRYHMIEARRQVIEDWKSDTGSHHHLPAPSKSYTQPSNSECPQGTYLRGFACPCVARLPGYKFLCAKPQLAPGPTLILVPAAVLPQWRKHLSQHIDTEFVGGASRPLQIWEVSKAVPRATQQKFPKIQFIEGEEGLNALQTEDPIRWHPKKNVHYTYFSAQHSNAIILTTHSVWSNINEPNKGWQESAKGGKLFPGSDDSNHAEDFRIRVAVRSALIVIDEVHSIKTATTGFWTLLENMSLSSVRPLQMVGLSATPILGSPHDLDALVGVFAKPSKREGLIEGLNIWARDARWLDTHADDEVSEDAAKREAYDALLKKVQAQAAAMMKRIGLRLRCHDQFRGHDVIEYQRQPIPARIPCEPQAYIADILQLCETSKKESKDTIEKMIKAAKHSNSHLSLAECFDKLVPARGKQGTNTFHRLEMVAVFPALAEEYNKGHKEPAHAEIERDIFTDGWLEDPAEHPYYDLVRRSLDTSPKLVKLFQIIDQMMDDEEPHRGVDGICKKKAVVFSKKPLVAQMVVLALRIRYPQILVTFLHNASRQKKDQLAHPFQADPSPLPEQGNQCQILVSTTGICGTGINLTRCNYCVLMDVSNNNQEMQAVSRVDRWGQKATPHLYRLVAMTNPAERIVVDRDTLRKKLYQQHDVADMLRTMFDMPPAPAANSSQAV